ncbi:MAG: prepilin-type N-terminal cleavage/methylation domain-containing protein [Planctomycetota bacterium]
MTDKRAFTLIELLVVIAIIALLLAIITPSLRLAKAQGQKAVCAAHIRSLLQGIYVYAAQNNDYIPTSVEGNNASWNFVCWQTFFPEDKPVPSWICLGRLYGTKVIDDPEIFYCPAQKNKLLQNHQDAGWDWVSPSGNEEKLTSYMYGLLEEIRSMPELQFTSLKLADLKKRALISDTFMTFGEGPVWAHPKGLNVGFGAGHVEFLKIDKEIIDIAEDMDNYGIDDRDLFVGAMFDLFVGKPQVMEEEFLSSTSP